MIAASPPSLSPTAALTGLLTLAETFQQRLQRVLRPLALTPSQYALLDALATLGPCHHRKLGAQVSRSSGNVTTVVDHLERDSLVQRERNRADRRLVTVHLTEAGRARYRQAQPLVTAVAAELVPEGMVSATLDLVADLTPEPEQDDDAS